jgi:hypothetical protein
VVAAGVRGDPVDPARQHADREAVPRADAHQLRRDVQDGIGRAQQPPAGAAAAPRRAPAACRRAAQVLGQGLPLSHLHAPAPLALASSVYGRVIIVWQDITVFQ